MLCYVMCAVWLV